MQHDDESRLLQSMYELFQNPLKKFVKYKGVSNNDLDDVVQEVFYSYYLHYELDKPEEEMRNLLLSMACNKVIDYHRARKDFISIEDVLDDIELSNRHRGDDGLSEVLRDERRKEIRDVIMNMKKEWRDALIYYVVLDMSTEEVCGILDITEGALRARISRARKYLRTNYGYLNNLNP